MTVAKILEILGARLVCGSGKENHDVDRAFASDLMSDVLTLVDNNVLLITGLANLQTLRTAEMSDIQCVIFARNKSISQEMIELAEENDIILIHSQYSVFRISGLLYQAGILPVF